MGVCVESDVGNPNEYGQVMISRLIGNWLFARFPVSENPGGQELLGIREACPYMRLSPQ
jgi:hypothetical protein